MGFLAFDIETGPLGDDRLLELCPPAVLPVHPGVFDPAAAKVGNLKDPGKIREKIEAAREACEAARVKAFADFKSRAALDATTGRVVAIGFLRDDQMDAPDIIDCDQDEQAGLREWWDNVEDALHDRLPLIGFNVCHFDLPFLVRRSWLLGVPVPAGLRKGRYWSDLIVDLMQVWGFHGRDMIGLDRLARAFGIAGKVTQAEGAEVSGAEFARLWRDNRKAAEAYLHQDVWLCARLAERMEAA